MGLSLCHAHEPDLVDFLPPEKIGHKPAPPDKSWEELVSTLDAVRDWAEERIAKVDAS
ncbi:hypothetical protein FHU41_001808 [Psychromicrobium silvestre]|uniref:Uncharacterized protein n=1 Tax=Psychromicrobium silvestre TaxID=1645614 RepID=A0A7Y9LTX8_9MICC|nr:hypothetical protein [Psychromicrobium silvestre]NYE95558.1 hypothetical protein [Psychromicrobium silvestre]